MNSDASSRVWIVRLLVGMLTAAMSSASLAQADSPRIMILADTSAAMDEAIYHPDYDPNTNWSGCFDQTFNYPVKRTMNYTPYSFHQTWPHSPSVVLVTSDHGRSSFYSGNYLNWVFFHADSGQRSALPRATKISDLKSLLSAMVFDTPEVDFGLTIFNGSHGGLIRVPFGVSRNLLVSAISGMTSDTYAPMAESMEDILHYFQTFSATPGITSPRQSTSCLVMAGGMPTMDLDISEYLRDADGDGNDPGTCTSLGASYPDSCDCSGYLDDVAWYMAHRDLRPDMEGMQVASTYVVAIGVDYQLFRDTAANGHGQYFSSGTGLGLHEALDSVVADILERASAPAPVDRDTPATAVLQPCQPNPFNPATTIRFELPGAGPVRMAVFDVAGHLVRALVDDSLPQGSHETVWDGRDASGREMGSGSYLARLEFRGKVESIRMGLIR